MDSAGRRIRVWREHLGLAQHDVELAAGIGENVLGTYERGVSSPTDAQLDRIIQGLGLPGSTVAERMVAFWIGPPGTSPVRVEAPVVPGKGEGDKIMLRVFRGVPVRWDATENEIGIDDIPRVMLPRKGEGCVVVIADDDSMEPPILAGRSKVLIDTHKTKPSAKDIVAVALDGATMIRVWRREGRHIVLQAFNHWVKPVVLDRADQVRVLGTVIEVRTDFRQRKPK
jgi:transcriptional regulator with XRE-family HTH domain